MTSAITQQASLNPRWCLAQDTIDRQDIDRLIDWLRTYPRLTKGAVTVEFEQQWDRWLSRSRSVHCNSGSSANLLMYDAVLLSGRLRNKKVIVPSVGWVTSIAPAIQLGFEPIMCEADPDTFGLDLTHLEVLLQRHEPHTVMLVQVLGVPHKMDEIMTLKERYGFILLEDACAAIGATYRGKKVGAFGDMASFSFYFGHQMSTIEGGMVCTNDPDFYQTLRMLRSHGMVRECTSPDLKAKFTAENADLNPDFIFAFPAYNVRSTELNAILGRSQLKRLDANNRKRTENLLLFLENLDPSRYQVDFRTEGSSNYAFTLILNEPDDSFRDRVMQSLRAHGVEFRRGTSGGGNQLRQPYLKKLFGDQEAKRFPRVDHVHFYGFYIGNYPSLERASILELCALLNSL